MKFYRTIVFGNQEAEISASITTGSSRNLDTAQKKGSTILNLKCVDAQVLVFHMISTFLWLPSYCFKSPFHF